MSDEQTPEQSQPTPTEVADTMTQQEADRVDQEKASKPELPGIGHNAGDDDVGGVTGKRLIAYLERIERLEEEKSALAEDVKEVYGEAKGFGFDTKTMRKIVRLRKMDLEKRREEDELLELYKAAINME